jgi:hypothetical protein
MRLHTYYVIPVFIQNRFVMNTIPVCSVRKDLRLMSSFVTHEAVAATGMHLSEIKEIQSTIF